MAALSEQQQQMASPAPLLIETQHDDMIHSTTLNYYGTRLLTTSSDRTLKIYTLTPTSSLHTSTITGHTGPVWCGDWAHPKYGTLVASCGFDGTVLVHRESPGDVWTEIKRYSTVTDGSLSLNLQAQAQQACSMNCIEFAPQEYGLILACASSDGRVTVLKHDSDDTWASSTFLDNNMGVNSLSFAPFNSHTNAVNSDGSTLSHSPLRLAVVGCDNKLRFHSLDSASNTWKHEDNSISTNGVGHSDWIRDVAWKPCTDDITTVCTCGEDGLLIIWSEDTSSPNSVQQTAKGNSVQKWTGKVIHDFKQPVWKVSWSVTGNVLAVSCGEGEVSLWKKAGEVWERVGGVGEEGGQI